jgi:hypothetical protein
MPADPVFDLVESVVPLALLRHHRRLRFVAPGYADLDVDLLATQDLWLGQSEKNLHAAFEAAQAQRPSVLFFDEVDALAAKRSD